VGPHFRLADIGWIATDVPGDSTQNHHVSEFS
jgi:hypothetical protein